jgi:phospholipid/cholesterol/gamma-HCH transport system ATP-binding protein
MARSTAKIDTSKPVVEARGVEVGCGEATILQDRDRDVYRGEILGFVGGSGTGKSVLRRAILGRPPPRHGTIQVIGKPLDQLGDAARMELEARWGVRFQTGALVCSLTVKENIQVPMREHYKVSRRLMDDLALVKLEMVGLPRDAADKMPSELSGGMVKRASLARSLALDPELLFLDEPTSGLDPIGAAAFDELIGSLRDTLGLTVYMVTHDLDSLYSVCDRIAVLAEKRVLVAGDLTEMLNNEHPWVRSYFHGERGERLVASAA